MTTASARRYLFDTDVLSEVVRNPHGEVARRAASFGRSEVGTSIVVAAELRYGARRKGSDRLTRQLEAVLEGVDILPLEEPADRHYAQIRTALEGAGQKILRNDLIIAAHARSLGATVVTGNVREFARVPGLGVENWLAG